MILRKFMGQVKSESNNSFLKKYAKNLDIITFTILSLVIIVNFVALIISIEVWGYTTLIGLVVLFINSIITNRLSAKKLNPYRIVTIEKWVVYLILIAGIFFYFNIAILIIQVIPEINPLSDYSEVIRIGFFLGVSFPTFLSTIALGILFIPLKEKVLLRLEVSLKGLNYSVTDELQLKRKFINKYFKFFKDALEYSNEYVGFVFPNSPQVVDLKKYYDHAYLKALIGTEEEVNNVRNIISALAEAIEKKDFREYLISLNQLKGQTNEKTSIEELSEMITLSNFSTKIKKKLKWIGSAILIIIGFIASIIKILEFLNVSIPIS